MTSLTQLLKDDAKFLYGVEEKLMLLRQDLEWINSFLKSSEGKRDEHEVVKVVIRQIKDVASQAQDEIDNYFVDVVHHFRKGKLEEFFHNFNRETMLNGVNNQIEMVKAKIKSIYDNKDKYAINEGEGESDAELSQRLISCDVDEDGDHEVVVGFDGYATEVINLLVKDSSSSREVVSIIGMAGCGKTTLARKVYRDPKINKHFDCCTWEFIFKEFNTTQFLLSLLSSFEAIPKDEINRIEKKMNNEKQDGTYKSEEIAILKNMLREYLSNMRYLIVLDGMCSIQVFEEIEDAFPYDKMGSQILILTRFEEVALKISTIKPYKLKHLDDEQSWNLMSKKVFRGGKCPPNLEVAGRNIAIACRRMPLSIMVMAGILQSKEKSEQEWKKVLGNVNMFIGQENALVKEIVRFSYESLPRRLKPCFLYFAIYPEDYHIPVRQLLHLWIAEGFIAETANGSTTVEDIAEEYLEELVCRNLIQVESRRTDGGVKTCRIHDLLRELCISESIKDTFLVVQTNINYLKEDNPRRLSLHGNAFHYMSESMYDHSSTRSLFNLSKDEYGGFYIDFMKWIRKNFKLIRVLEIGKVEKSYSVLGELEELIHLRYIRTGDHGYCSFPKSIYNLWNLETLDIRGSMIIDLPDGIWKLKKLRHLYMSGEGAAKFPNIPGRKVLPNLQTLSIICFGKTIVEHLEKGKFPNLKKLGIDCCFSNEITHVNDYLQRLKNLTHLNTLKIINGMTSLPNVEGFPPNLTKITLIGDIFLSEFVNPLGSLTKLKYLKVTREQKNDKYKEFKLECTKSGCFPQLLVLKMTNLNFVSWNMEEGAMPRLRRLIINNCELSTNLPSVESFTNLQELEVLWSAKEVVDKFQHLVVKDSCKFTVYPAMDE